MGHIVNSNGMRLGWMSNWCDLWYSELIYYPEYLHLTYRIRFFLIYYLDMPVVEERGFFFSHFEIEKNFKLFLINLYYYDGQGESLYSDMLFDYRITLKRDVSSPDPERRIWLGFFEPLKILIILSLLFNFDLIGFGDRRSRDLIRALRVANISYIKYIVSNADCLDIETTLELTVSEQYTYIQSIYLAFLLYFIMYNLFNKTKIVTSYIMESTLKRFFFSIACEEWLYGFFFMIIRIMLFFLDLITPLLNFDVNIYAITNNCVNSKFLSRFIARKFEQEYSFYELLNPIRKELRIVCLETRGSYKGFFFNKLKDNIDTGKILVYKKDLYKSFLTFIFLNYNKYSFKFFYKYLTWFSLNMLNIYIWINQIINCVLKKIIFSIKYFIRKGAFSYFFTGYFNSHIENFNSIFYPHKNEIISILPLINYLNFLNFIYEDFLICNNIIIKSKIINSKNMQYFRYIQYFFNKYMQFNYWVYNDFLISKSVNYNMLKNRISKKKGGGLLGFKMQCSGRFTRKQRASSIWFSYGTTPLNTLKEEIDYAYYSIPILNSQITIKVWLHTTSLYTKWWYKLI